MIRLPHTSALHLGAQLRKGRGRVSVEAKDGFVKVRGWNQTTRHPWKAIVEVKDGLIVRLLPLAEAREHYNDE